MKHDQRNMPSESELLAYVEDTLPADARAAIDARIGSDERALVGLSRLRADREALARLRDLEPPASLLEDCLSVVERSVLISDGPMAPPIAIDLRRARGRWRRFAAAAVFFIAVAGGGWWIARTTLFQSHDPGFLNASEREAALREANRKANSDAGVEPIRNPKERGSEFDENHLAANSSLALNSDERDPAIVPPVNRDDPAGLAVRSDEAPFMATPHAELQASSAEVVSIDPGFGVRLSAHSDRDRTLRQLHTLVSAETGSALVFNSPPMERIGIGEELSVFDSSLELGAHRDGGGSGRSDMSGGSGLSDSSSNSNNANRSGGASDRVERNEATIASDLLLVSLADQHAYRESGFDYTLVGTPSHVKSILAALNADVETGGRVRVLRRTEANGEAFSLDDLVAPARPIGREWARALLWFSDPERHFPLAVRMHEAYQPEPIIRVPIRITGK